MINFGPKVTLINNIHYCPKTYFDQILKKPYFHFKALKDLLFASNQVTQYCKLSL